MRQRVALTINLARPAGKHRPSRPGLSDDHSELEPPDPFPNSEVKRLRADGSVRSPHVRVGHRRASQSHRRQSCTGGNLRRAQCVTANSARGVRRIEAVPAAVHCAVSARAAIAQVVEQLTCNEKVQRSTRCGGTNYSAHFYSAHFGGGGNDVDTLHREGQNSETVLHRHFAGGYE